VASGQAHELLLTKRLRNRLAEGTATIDSVGRIHRHSELTRRLDPPQERADRSVRRSQLEAGQPGALTGGGVGVTPSVDQLLQRKDRKTNPAGRGRGGIQGRLVDLRPRRIDRTALPPGALTRPRVLYHAPLGAGTSIDRRGV
jgi:hypothetical protein